MRSYSRAAGAALVLCLLSVSMAFSAPEAGSFRSGKALPLTREFTVTGYLPSYALREADSVVLAQVDRIIYFAVGIRATGELSAIPPRDLEYLRSLKDDYGFEVYLGVADHGVAGRSLGGLDSGDSRGFGAILRDEAMRKRFSESVWAVLADGFFDGIDLDWEWPGSRWESERYSELLVELSCGLGELGIGLSVAMSPWQEISAEAASGLTGINLMLYDNPGPHSTYEDAAAGARSFLNRNGIDPGFVSLGIPFYGRGLSSQGTSWYNAVSYRTLVSRFKPEAGSDLVEGYAYNSASTVSRKTQYALEGGFGGVMIWHIAMDVPGDRSLSGVIRRVADDAAGLRFSYLDFGSNEFDPLSGPSPVFAALRPTSWPAALIPAASDPAAPGSKANDDSPARNPESGPEHGKPNAIPDGVLHPFGRRRDDQPHFPYAEDVDTGDNIE